MSDTVHLERGDNVATLWLTDPDRRNALSNDMVAAIGAALDDVESDGTTRALVVTGRGRAFCAGADLSQLGASREQGLRTIYEGFTRVAASPLVTIAAINGPAVGAGMNLALACDVRLAANAARFDTRFMNLGIGPGGGHTWWMQKITGPQTAAAMVLCSEVLDAADALRVGLVWEVVDDAVLHERALELAAGAARAPYELLRRTKATMAATAAGTHAEALETELATQVWSMDQPEFAARLAELAGRISARGQDH